MTDPFQEINHPGTLFFRGGHLVVVLAGGQTLSLTTGGLLEIGPRDPCTVLRPEKAAEVLARDLRAPEDEMERLRAEVRCLQEQVP